jgi:hypothetical protein
MAGAAGAKKIKLFENLIQELLKNPDPRKFVEMARKRGWTTQQIVLAITQGASYAGVIDASRVYAEILEITKTEFKALAGRLS